MGSYYIFCLGHLDLFLQENSDMLNACRTLAVKEASLSLSLKAELVIMVLITNCLGYPALFLQLCFGIGGGKSRS